MGQVSIISSTIDLYTLEVTSPLVKVTFPQLEQISFANALHPSVPSVLESPW